MRTEFPIDVVPVPRAGAILRRNWRWVIIPVVAIALLSGGAWLLLRDRLGGGTAGGTAGGSTIGNGIYHTVLPIHMDLTVAREGNLQAVNNIDIFCQVEGSTTIQTVIKEGASVQKGDVLAELESSAIRTKIDDTQRLLDTATADVVTAQEAKEIQLLSNASNLEAADSTLLLAKLDLEQYSDGTYPQQLDDAKTNLEMAQITLKNKQEDLSQTKSLYEKGFVTAADVKKSELEVTTADNGVSKAETALKVLTQYSDKMNSASKKNAVVQAEQRLVRVKRENASNLAQKVADLQAKQAVLKSQQRNMEAYQTQLLAHTIKAPAAGLVVYGTSADRNAQNPIQAGATVRNQQLLFRLPDTSSMKAVIRVPEAQFPQVEVGQYAVVQIGSLPPVEATVDNKGVMADNSQRWWNPDLNEYPVELTLSSTPPNLNPGVGCKVMIYVRSADDALAVPLSTIYSAGADRYVFVRHGEEVTPAKIKVGLTNDTHAQVTEGLNASDDVLILKSGQGRELLERAGIKTDVPTNNSRGGKGGGDGSNPGGRKKRPEA